MVLWFFQCMQTPVPTLVLPVENTVNKQRCILLQTAAPSSQTSLRRAQTRRMLNEKGSQTTNTPRKVCEALSLVFLCMAARDHVLAGTICQLNCWFKFKIWPLEAPPDIWGGCWGPMTNPWRSGRDWKVEEQPSSSMNLMQRFQQFAPATETTASATCCSSPISFNSFMLFSLIFSMTPNDLFYLLSTHPTKISNWLLPCTNFIQTWGLFIHHFLHYDCFLFAYSISMLLRRLTVTKLC